MGILYWYRSLALLRMQGTNLSRSMASLGMQGTMNPKAVEDDELADYQSEHEGEGGENVIPAVHSVPAHENVGDDDVNEPMPDATGGPQAPGGGSTCHGPCSVGFARNPRSNSERHCCERICEWQSGTDQA